MRILYVLEHYYPYIGGAEKLFQNVAEAMATQGHEVLVVTTRHDQNLSEKETINGVDVERVTCFNRFVFTFVAFFHLLRLQRDFDVIHATTYNAALPAWLYSRYKSRKNVLTFHEVWGELWFRLPFLNPIQRWGYYLYEKMVLQLRFDQYIAVSGYTKRSLVDKGIPSERITKIYNGVSYPEEDCWSPLDDDVFRLTYFGRLGVSKGLDILIPAFHDIISEGHKAQLDLILPYHPKKVLRKVLRLIDQGEASKSINILHDLPRKELTSVICGSDAVVVPSYSEGFCFVAAETCALGVPVIHSGRGALAEVVSGKHIFMKDMSVSSLKESIKLGILGKWTQTERREFPLDRSIHEYLQLYNIMMKS